MSREYRLYLRDMLEATVNIGEYVSGLNPAAFNADKLRNHAVLYNLYVIGEAVRSIPQDVRARYPNVDWRRINALRNLIAHAYFAINLDRIWLLATEYVPRLQADVQAILDSEADADQPDS